MRPRIRDIRARVALRIAPWLLPGHTASEPKVSWRMGVWENDRPNGDRYLLARPPAGIEKIDPPASLMREIRRSADGRRGYAPTGYTREEPVLAELDIATANLHEKFRTDQNRE